MEGFLNSRIMESSNELEASLQGCYKVKGWQDHVCFLSNVYRTVQVKGSGKAIFLDVWNVGLDVAFSDVCTYVYDRVRKDNKVFALTWAIWEKTAGATVKLLHESNLPVILQAKEVSLTKHKNRRRWLVKRDDTNVKSLLSNVQSPVHLQSKSQQWWAIKTTVPITFISEKIKKLLYSKPRCLTS